MTEYDPVLVNALFPQTKLDFGLRRKDQFTKWMMVSPVAPCLMYSFLGFLFT